MLWRRMERWLLNELAHLQAKRLHELGPVVAAHMRHNTAAGVVVPGQAEHDALIAQYARALWMWGHSHGWQETKQHPRPRLNFADPPQPPGPVPTDAVAWARSRVVLQGKWQRDLDAKVTEVIALGLQTGATEKQVMDALRKIFPEFGKARLENITRTESVAAYNQGRLEAFRQNPFVAAVQFTAILDNRTTAICRDRDGLILRLDDERLEENTPPLHFQCRSVLVPVDKYDLQDLEAGQDAAEQSYFAWTGKNGPKSLSEAESRWKSVPKPLPGFGTVKDTTQATVATPHNAEASHPAKGGDGGVGYPEIPRPATPTQRGEVKEDIIKVGHTEVPLIGVWPKAKESETVEEALGVFKPDSLKGLKVEFTTEAIYSNPPKGSKSPRKQSNAKYLEDGNTIQLSRAATRNWASPDSSVANTTANQAMAIATLRHEVAHHIFFTGGPELDKAWTAAFLADGEKTLGRDWWELFANNMALYIDNPEKYRGIYKNMGKFLEGLLE